MSKYRYKCYNRTLNHRDHKAVGRRPFDKMATLLAYLGPPEHKPVADTHWSSLNLTSSKFEEFMTRWLFLLLPKARVSLLFSFYPEIARVKFVITVCIYPYYGLFINKLFMDLKRALDQIHFYLSKYQKSFILFYIFQICGKYWSTQVVCKIKNNGLYLHTEKIFLVGFCFYFSSHLTLTICAC